MRRLNYHPNAMARGLVRRNLQTIGVLFGNVEPAIVTNAYAATVLQGVLEAAADLDYNVIFFTAPWQGAARSAARFRDKRTDGILVIAPLQDSDMVLGLAALGIPLIVVSAPCPAQGVACVDVDNEKGGRLAASHLLGLGHTRIAHLTGEPNFASVPARLAGFRATLVAAGVPVRSEYVVQASYAPDEGLEGALRLLSLSSPPTAIFAGNDMLALRTLEAARLKGFAVPHQLSLVGFDDIPAAALVTPGLTTVRQPLARIGELATRLLVARVENPNDAPPAATHVQEPELVVRGSTAPPSPN